MDKPEITKTSRENKKVVNGEIVRVRKGHPRTNLPVILPENPTWMKHPNAVTFMAYDYSIIQLKVLMALLTRFQDAIEDSVNKTPLEQLLPFKEFKNEEKISMLIQFKELGVLPSQYNQVKSALTELATIPIHTIQKDPITGKDSWTVEGLFKAYVPDEKYARTFTLSIDKMVAKKLIEADTGYTKYIKEIAHKAKSKYTIKFYWLISSWKDKGGFGMKYSKFRKWLKIGNKYLEYKDLYKRIIRPVYEELFENSDCWFEIHEVYKEGEKEPYKLNFKVIKSAPSKREQQHLKLQLDNIERMLSFHLKMSDKQIQMFLPFVNLDNCTLILDKIVYLKQYTNENWKKIKNVSEYCLSALLKEFDVETRELEEIQGEIEK